VHALRPLFERIHDLFDLSFVSPVEHRGDDLLDPCIHFTGSRKESELNLYEPGVAEN
jgi:hypothetical protein